MMNTQQAIQSAAVNQVINPMNQWLDSAEPGQIKVGHAFSTTSHRILQAHEHLYVDGDSQTHFYQVLEGVVGIYKLLADGRRQIVTFCYPGDFIGLDRSGVFMNHAEALSSAVVRSIPHKAIDSLIMTEPGFGQAILGALSTELAESREQLLSLGRKSALEKVASFLLGISRRNVRAERDADLLHIPMTRGDIADYLGLTIETVSRNFTKLKLSRAIRLNSNSEIQVVDRDKLEAIAEEGTALKH